MDHLNTDQKIQFARNGFAKIVATNTATNNSNNSNNQNQTAGDDDLSRNQVADGDTVNRQEASAYFQP